MTKTFTLQNGVTISVKNKPLGDGGEGKVYEILSPSNLRNSVVKILFPEKRTIEKQYKLRYMVDNPPAVVKDNNGHNFLIWPQQLLFENNNFVGFSMPKADGIELEELCRVEFKPELGQEWGKFYRKIPSSMKLRLVLCSNIAKALNALHSTGHYVIGDFKPENIIVKSNGLVSFIDLDSCQISDGKQIRFQSKMNTPKYSPPDSVSRNKDLSWDLFIIGIIFYEILCGIHPFVGTTKTPYEKLITPEQKIQAGLFPFGSKANYFEVIAPPHLNFKRLSIDLQNLFLKCFDQGILNPSMRPNSLDWINSLIASPNITFFRANTEKIVIGSSIYLSWNVKNANNITINKGIGDVSNISSKEIKLRKTTSLRLVATNSFGKDEKEISIKVLPPPEIKTFKAHNSKIEYGKCTKIVWNIANAQKVELHYSDKLDVLNRKGEKEVFPKEDTTYKLIITALDGITIDEREINIRVFKRIQIKSFTNDLNFIIDGIPLKLGWDVENAEKIILNINKDKVIDVTERNEYVIEIKKDSSFWLSCENSLFKIESEKIKIRLIKNKWAVDLKNLIPDMNNLTPNVNDISHTYNLENGHAHFEFSMPGLYLPNTPNLKIDLEKQERSILKKILNDKKIKHFLSKISNQV